MRMQLLQGLCSCINQGCFSCSQTLAVRESPMIRPLRHREAAVHLRVAPSIQAFTALQCLSLQPVRHALLSQPRHPLHDSGRA